MAPEQVPPDPQDDRPSCYPDRECAAGSSYRKNTGLHHVYLDNVHSGGGKKTFCPFCGTVLLERSGYRILINLLANGLYPKCGKSIAGIWS